MTQNSGVSLITSIMQFANAKDNNLVFGEMTFSGVVIKIWELSYNNFCIPICKCNQVDNNNEIKHDKLKFTCVDLRKKKIRHKFDPFILASHVKQGFYIEDPIDSRWHVMLSTTKHEETDDRPFEHAPNNTMLLQGSFASQIPNVDSNFDDNNCDSIYVQSDCKGIQVNTL